MKNINQEIANITKLTLAKIIDVKITSNDIEKAIETNKGNLN